MATREGTRASAEFICTSLVPDVCKSPGVPVPYKILSLFDCAVNFSSNVNFRKQPVFRHNSRLSTVRCNEPGVGGGLLSGVNMGWCRPIDGTASTTVRVNGSFVDYHEGTYMFMNCAGPEGPWNTIGQVTFLGNMLPGPVSSSGKVPKSSSPWCGGALSKLKDSVGDVSEIVKKGKLLYSLAQTDWSDPSSVLGAIGGVAGLAGLNNVAGMAAKAKEYYDTGEKLLDTDWSDPKQALAAVAGAAAVADMHDIAAVAGLANKINDIVQTDWSDPVAAYNSATNIVKSTGLNNMFAAMASNAISNSNLPVSTGGTIPAMFPQPGASRNGNTPGTGTGGSTIPVSADGKPRQPVTAALLEHIRQTNPVAAARYDLMSDVDKAGSFVERAAEPGVMGDETTAIYLPGEGFSTSQQERDALPNLSQYVPRRIRELFVADAQDAKDGNFFGIKEKEGNVYLFGGLIDLGSPEMPGAGNAWAWWVPDRILNMDMSPYYDYHDKYYYGSDVRLSDIGKILSHEVEAFKAGAGMNPLQLPLQAIYSSATALVGIGTATVNSAMDAGESVFSSLGDFYDSVFGESPKSSGTPSIDTGGCFGLTGSSSGNHPQSSPAGAGGGSSSGGGVGGAASGAASGANPGSASASAPAGGSPASGAPKDGVLITIAAGSPAAKAAAIEAQFRAENAKALEEARAKEAAQKKAEEEARKKADAEQQDAGANPARSDVETKPAAKDPNVIPVGKDAESQPVGADSEKDKYSDIANVLDSKDSDWEKARRLVELAKDKFPSTADAHNWLQEARRQSQDWSSSVPLTWAHYNLKGELGGWAGIPLFEGYDALKFLGLDDEYQWAGHAAENFVRNLEGKSPLENPFKWKPSEWNRHTSDWYYAGVRGETPREQVELPPGYMRHPLFPNIIVGPDGKPANFA